MAYYPRDIMCGTCGEALAVKRGPDKRPICEMCDQTKASEPMPDATCKHCGRTIVQPTSGSRWIDPDATGDDSVWRETCDAHDTFTGEHEPEEQP